MKDIEEVGKWGEELVVGNLKSNSSSEVIWYNEYLMQKKPMT